MKKIYLLFLFNALLVSNKAYAQSYFFYDDFEQYSAGNMLACQDSINWTTWHLNPCDTVEDSYVTNAYAYSGSNSFVCVANNDEVHHWGPYTTGHWQIYFYNYIPAGKSGYFNTLAKFMGESSEWGLEVSFDPFGNTWVRAGGNYSGFDWIPDSWVLNKVIVDLDDDQAEYWYNGTLICQWQWTLGYNGFNISLQIAANDFYGYWSTDEMYVDDYQVFKGYLVPVEVNVVGPTTFNLSQNFPNPFNPTTTIGYEIKEKGNVKITVLNSIGEEVAVIVDEEKESGYHTVEFNAATLPSGVYFYQLKSGQFISTKKMILMK